MPLSWFLILSAVLFSIGLYTTLVRRNAINILMGIELMLNAVNINLVAFWRYITPSQMTGQIFAIFVITVAAAEAAVGLALVLAIYRTRNTVNLEDINLLKW
ncbi:MAG: NADH-quinone oxidoreductase subunit NuoK [Chloroflexi bacterium]|nr:NADH-quinone oxidoreductase subunit NuoK [Chloroflexota bacterium]